MLPYRIWYVVPHRVYLAVRWQEIPLCASQTANGYGVTL
jgi:hypothetical protein